MRLGANRDAEVEDGWSGRRRHQRPEPRDWFVDDDVASYSQPHRPRREEVQRPVDRPPRNYAGRRSRSIDASQFMMPPPPPSMHLPHQSPTLSYRRPREAVLYPDDEEESDGWRRSRRGRSPDYDRPRQPIYHAPSPLSQSASSSEDLGDGEIEVVEERDEDDYHEHREHRRPRRLLPSGDDYMDSSEERQPRRRRHHRRRSLDDDEIEVEVRHSSPERDPPYHRSPVRHEPIDSPRKGRTQRVSSILESSRPPVASQRVSKVYESKEIIRETRPRRSSTTQATQATRRSRSSSRRPPSIFGSIFGGSSRGPSPERHLRQYECIACTDEYPSYRVAKLRCGHRMCHNCLKRRFKVSTTDPQAMPPRCCTSDHIPLRHVERLFDDAFKRSWNRKFAEYSARDRFYCSRCGEWVKPNSIQREDGRKCARCNRCKTKVCVTCNGKWHASRECPRDDDTIQFLEQAKEEGWKRCYRCKAMVELREGCSHMTCRCGAEFCMICGTKWRNCDCPCFSYDGVDDDGIDDMDVPIPPIRGDHDDTFLLDRPPSPGDIRPQPRALPATTRPRAQSYEEGRLLRQRQQQREVDKRRKAYIEEDGEYGGILDVLDVGHSAGRPSNDNHRRGSQGFSPPPLGPPGYERPHMGGNYISGVSKARGVRGGSMERRLADRFSEHRGSIPGMDPIPPLSPKMGSPMMPPPMGMPPPLGPILGPHMADEGMMYDRGGIRSPHDRVIVEEDPDDYDDDELYREPRGGRRRRRLQRREEPKSSTLAGLGGSGQGMGRVGVWRKYVEPGDPDGELATTVAPA